MKSSRVFRVLTSPFSGRTGIARTFETAREVDDYLCHLRDGGEELTGISVVSQLSYVMGGRRYKSSANTQETAKNWLGRRKERRVLYVCLWRKLFDDSEMPFHDAFGLYRVGGSLGAYESSVDEFSYILDLRLRVASKLHREFGSEL